MDRTRQAVADMAREDPALAARLVIQTLPAAAAKVPGKLTYGLVVEGLGEYTVVIDSGRAEVIEGLNGTTDFNLSTSVSGLAELAAGTSPLRLIVSGRVRIRGNRLRARKLRAMSNGPVDLADVISNGGHVDPDLLYRSLPYLIDPEWTRGHAYLLRYAIGDQSWDIEVRDGEPIRVSEPSNGREPDAVVDGLAGHVPQAGQPRALTHRRDAAPAHVDRGPDLPGHAARPLDRPLAGPRRRRAGARAPPAPAPGFARGQLGLERERRIGVTRPGRPRA